MVIMEMVMMKMVMMMKMMMIKMVMLKMGMMEMMMMIVVVRMLMRVYRETEKRDWKVSEKTMKDLLVIEGSHVFVMETMCT